MTKLLSLSAFAVLLASSSAPAQQVRTVTSTSTYGTAVTEITRNGNTVSTRTTFTPAGKGYQPMGGTGHQPMGAGGGHQPMGSTGYKPMGQ